MQLLSSIESFIDENDSTYNFISLITDKDIFLKSIKSYDEEFSNYNLSKPKLLTKLKAKIISLINELDKKRKNSKSYQKKRKKILIYGEIYFDICGKIFIDDNKTEIKSRIEEIEVNSINNETYSNIYPVY